MKKLEKGILAIIDGEELKKLSDEEIEKIIKPADVIEYAGGFRFIEKGINNATTKT